MQNGNRSSSLVLAGLTVVVALAATGQAMAQAPAVKKFAGTKAGQEWGSNGLKMKFCWCPPGKFMMGSPQDEKKNAGDEHQVKVTLTRGFWLGKYEATQAQWKAMIGTQPWAGKRHVKEGDDYPVTYVSWGDAVKFCAELTKKDLLSGKLPVNWEYRLPTDAQWEYACRAGSKTRFSFGDDDSQLGGYAWFDKNARIVGEKYAHRVGGKRANVWGLHDMHGNVYEWCRDWYELEVPGGTDPEVTKMGSRRVHRGGSWYYFSWFCRSAARYRSRPGDRSSLLGFRVAAVQSSQ